MPDDVFEQLVRDVMAGDLGPGAPLPSERRLAELLGVSRPAVREALQRLSAAGLVEVRQGDTTTVRDYRRYGGLDLLPRLLVSGGELDLAVARSILEARLAIGPTVAHLAARRRTDEVVDALRGHVAALGATEDQVARQRIALDYWEVVVDAADSITFRLMFNSLRAAYEPTLDALAAVMASEVEQRDRYAALTDAIAAADPARARDEAASLLTPVTLALTDLLERLDAADPDNPTTAPPEEKP